MVLDLHDAISWVLDVIAYFQYDQCYGAHVIYHFTNTLALTSSSFGQDHGIGLFWCEED
jgi:hypothetical protein